MGTKHSTHLDEYLNHESYPDALRRSIRREFERAVSHNAQQALEQLKAGDPSRHDRNESFILGALPAEVHQEARLFLYGPYFASSSFVWAVVGDSDDRAMAGLRALSEGTRMSRQTSGASATSASSQGSRGRRSSSTTSVDDFHIVESKDAIPPLAQLVKPTTSGVAKARASPFLCSMASKVARHEVGKGGLVVGPSSQPGLLFIRAGSLNMQAAGEKSSVVHAGTGIETAMVLEDEVVVCTGGSNETSTLLRDSFTLTVASDYAVYGFISRKDVEAIVAGYRLTKIEAQWAKAVAEKKLARKRAAVAAAEVRRAQQAAKLCEAAEAGRVPELNRLLHVGVDPNCSCGPANSSPLHHAARTRQLAALTALLDAGADPHAKDRFGETALHYAARMGWRDGVSSLCERSCDLLCVPASSSHGNTPLHLAAQHGDVAVLLMMCKLAQLADVALPLHVENKQGATPINLAQSLEALRVLKPRTDFGCGMTVR